MKLIKKGWLRGEDEKSNLCSLIFFILINLPLD
ncbi:hypothetical protein X926_01115 [Petrotoga sp. HWHPT.55.6.3]|nr:hypothetical protein X926_01115 [Petrotoga sp. HWHPT.55.6.3]